jgi:hypothetical protein
MRDFMKSERDIIKELTLMLLYLTSWEENEIGLKYQRSWKGYDFDVLNELSEEELIYDGKRSKSIAFSDEGIEKAKVLLKKHDIGFEN